MGGLYCKGGRKRDNGTAGQACSVRLERYEIAIL